MSTGAKCDANTKRGVQCARPAGWGTDHIGYGQCKLHGGATPNNIKAAAMAIAVDLGAPVDVSPHEALIRCVRYAAGEVEYCTHRIADLNPEQYVGHPESFRHESSTKEDKEVRTEHPVELNIWIKVRQEAMDRLARYAKMALDAGVEERRVRLAEGMATALAPVLDAIFKELGLNPDQRKRAPAILEKNLLVLESEATEEPVPVGSNGGAA